MRVFVKICGVPRGNKKVLEFQDELPRLGLFMTEFGDDFLFILLRDELDGATEGAETHLYDVVGRNGEVLGASMALRLLNEVGKRDAGRIIGRDLSDVLHPEDEGGERAALHLVPKLAYCTSENEVIDDADEGYNGNTVTKLRVTQSELICRGAGPFSGSRGSIG